PPQRCDSCLPFWTDVRLTGLGQDGRSRVPPLVLIDIDVDAACCEVSEGRAQACDDRLPTATRDADLDTCTRARATGILGDQLDRVGCERQHPHDRSP